MSRHRIVGSEAFERSPFVYVRGFNKRRNRGLAIAVIAVVGGGVVAGVGFMVMAIGQAAGLF